MIPPAMISALCFCVGPAAPAGSGRVAARPGRARPEIPTPGRGPRKIPADGTDSQFVKFHFLTTLTQNLYLCSPGAPEIIPGKAHWERWGSSGGLRPPPFPMRFAVAGGRLDPKYLRTGSFSEQPKVHDLLRNPSLGLKVFENRLAQDLVRITFACLTGCPDTLVGARWCKF